MKRAASFIVTLALMTGICSCGTGNGDMIMFENDTHNGIDGLFICYRDDATWGDPINDSKIRSGDSIDITGYVTGEDRLFDIGAINSQGLNYDFSGVAIRKGDTLQLTLDEDEGVLTILTASGKTREYTCDTYKCEDKAQKNDVFFTNKTDVRIDGIYLSSKDATAWGSKLNPARIAKGDVFVIDSSALADGEDIYDFGAVDENSLNYDIFDVQLGPGYTAVLKHSKDEAILEVTSGSGKKQVYRGKTYLNKKQ